MNIGQTVCTSYEVTAELGSGGMGVTFLAEDEGGYGTVVLKVPRIEWTPSLRQRFVREIRVLSRLHHSNIVRILSANLSHEPPFYVMEYCERGSLMRNLTFADLFTDLGLLRNALDGIAWAHKHSVIHRDVKPDNILVDVNGAVKVADFGLAKFVERDSTTLTVSHAGLGTLRYMAPEQLHNAKDVTCAADVYSFGVVLCEVVSGRLPHEGLNIDSALRASYNEERRPLRHDILSIINRAAAQDSAERFADASELAEAIDSIVDEYTREREGLANSATVPLDDVEQACRSLTREEIGMLQQIYDGELDSVETSGDVDAESEYERIESLMGRRLVTGRFVTGDSYEPVGIYSNLALSRNGLFVLGAVNALKANTNHIME